MYKNCGRLWCLKVQIKEKRSNGEQAKHKKVKKKDGSDDLGVELEQ